MVFSYFVQSSAHISPAAREVLLPQRNKLDAGGTTRDGDPVPAPTKDEIIEALNKKVDDFSAYVGDLEKQMDVMRSSIAGLPEKVRDILREELSRRAESVGSPQTAPFINPSLHADRATPSAQDELPVQPPPLMAGIHAAHPTASPTSISPPHFQTPTNPHSISAISVPQVSASAIPDVQGSISRLSLSEDNDL